MKTKELSYYYRNREARIKYQREYDRNNKDKKRAYDKIRRETTDKNFKRKIQRYSQKHYLKKLLELYNGCQKCKSNKKLEIHHINYTKKFEDCKLLCQPCHKKVHRKPR